MVTVIFWEEDGSFEMCIRDRDEAVRYVESFGYVDDRRYVESFILSRKGRKSKREIFAELSRKQVDEAIVDEMMERCYDAEDSGEAIRRFLKKRHYDPEQATMEEKQKVYAYLARKGLSLIHIFIW